MRKSLLPQPHLRRFRSGIVAGAIAALALTGLVGTASPATAAPIANSVVGWGFNPSVPAGLTDVKAIDAGTYHALALKGDGTVTGWALPGASSGEATPPPGLSGVTAVAAGNSYSLALKSDGTVVGWGQNYQGQTSVPPGLGGVTAIAAGNTHAVALKSDGTVVEWGKVMNLENAYVSPMTPTDLSGVVAVAAGYNFSLALKSDGTVVEWGFVYPRQRVPEGLSGVTAIAAYPQGPGAAAVKGDGTVVGWRQTFDAQTESDQLRGVVAVDVGASFSVALKADGTVTPWGSAPFSAPPTGLSGATSVSAGRNVAFAVVDAPLDTDAPTAQPTVSPAPNGSGWSKILGDGDVELVYGSGSGLDPAACRTTTDVSGDGKRTVTASCTDLAGNTGESSVFVAIDTIAPTAAPTPRYIPNEPTEINWYWSDDRSGVGTECEYQTYTGSEQGFRTQSASCSDLAGNSHTERFLMFVDTLAPVASPRTIDTSPGTNAFTVTWNWSDGVSSESSGIDQANCTTSSRTSGQETQTLTATCTDKFGNVGTASRTFVFDTTAPGRGADAGSPRERGRVEMAPVTVTWNWTDTDSVSTRRGARTRAPAPVRAPRR